ncbi:MAG: hypothetical protein HYY04_02960 [Chloroflexi bacterium]|nr:hypothetical protein [Chloroflexota bacterium]
MDTSQSTTARSVENLVLSDRLLAGVSLRGSEFANPDGTKAYLDALCDLSVIIGGEYGWASHPAARVQSDFDRVRANDPFEPWFVTWANLFGPSLVARFGRERFLTAPAYLVRELADGSFLLTTAASPLDELNPEAQDTIRRVKAHLGILSPSERATPEELAAFESRRSASEAEMKQRIEDAFRRQREELAAEMLRQAEGCVEGARRFWGKQLDYSPASLAVVDDLIATGFGPDESRDTVETATQAFGAYVGEVVRRRVGGEWRGGFGNERPILVIPRPTRREVSPFEAVQRRFREVGVHLRLLFVPVPAVPADR